MSKEESDNPGIVTRLAIVETDLKWVKNRVDSLDTRTWVIVSGIGLSILLMILNLVR